MATVKGVNRTILDQTSVLHTLAPGLFGGRVRALVDTYELAALSNGDVIEMGGDLPVGAQVLFVILTFDALGASTTIDVGDEEDPNRYIAATSTSSAGSQVGILADGVEYEIDNTVPTTPDTQVLATLGGGAGTGTLKLVVFYTTD